MKITQSKEWYGKAKIITKFSAWLFCVIPTLIIAGIRLPSIVTEQPTQTLTGSGVIVIACLAYPIMKGFFKYFKNPSAWFIMWVLALTSLALYNLTRETLNALVWVFFAAAIGNSIGAILFKLSDIYAEKWKYVSQIEIIGGNK